LAFFKKQLNKPKPQTRSINIPPEIKELTAEKRRA
jgi:hypothetical protein